MSERIYQASDEFLYDALGFAEEELEKMDCPLKIVMQITVCVEEVFVNIAHYAYGDAVGSMKLSLSACDGGVEIEFRDRGIPFDPLAREDPDISLSAEERKVGGLGIYMVKQTMDDVTYRYEDGQNILTLKKNF